MLSSLKFAGILLGMDILRNSSGGLEGGNLIVVSDGQENTPPMIDNIRPVVRNFQ